MILSAVLASVPAAAFAATFAEVLKPDGVRAIVEEVTGVVTKQQAGFYRRDIVAERPFLDAAAKRAGEVETSLERLAAEWRLRGLYGVFLTHLVASLNEGQARGSLVLKAEAIEAYLARVLKLGRCGEIPCPNECKPCDKECDRCR